MRITTPGATGRAVVSSPHCTTSTNAGIDVARSLDAIEAGTDARGSSNGRPA